MSNDKVSITLEQVMNGYKKALELNNQKMILELSKLFQTIEDTILLDKNSEVVSFLCINPKIITLDSLAINYVKALYKNNNEMKQKLKKYLFQYMGNIEQGIDNVYIEQQIMDDKTLYQFMKQTKNSEDLEKYLLKNCKKKQNKQQKETLEKQPFVKGRPFIN